MQGWFSQIVIGIIVTVVGTVIANSIVRGPGGRPLHVRRTFLRSGAPIVRPLICDSPQRKRQPIGRLSPSPHTIRAIANQLSSCQMPVGRRQATISVRFVASTPLKTTTA